MSAPRGVPPKNKELVKELDARAVRRFRLRGLHRIKLYDGPAIRRAKKEREADAESWIAKLRARRAK